MNIKNNVYNELIKHRITHPNLCKLWISHLENNPSIQNYRETYQMLTKIKTVQDFTKFEILALYL